MQLDWNLSLSGEEYVTTQAWRNAKLDCCPAHSGGGCGFARHGTYRRKTRWGDALIPRWYCADAHMTWSLLARCFAARTPGTLDDLEAAVAAFEVAPGVQEAARRARPRHHICDRGAERRWVRWRADCVHRLLAIVIGLLPDLLRGAVPEITAFRARLGTESVLRDLRGLCAAHLGHLPPPVGFRPPGTGHGGGRGPPTLRAP